MLGQRPPSRLAPGDARSGRRVAACCGGVGLRHRLLQSLERQLQLFDARRALGRSTEAFPPELGDEELEPFDLDVEHPAGGARLGGLLLRRQPGGTLREDHRVRGGKVAGERLGGVRHIRERIIFVSVCNALLLAGSERAPAFLRHSPVDPFEKIAELRRRDRHPPVRHRRPQESPALERRSAAVSASVRSRPAKGGDPDHRRAAPAVPDDAT